MSRSSLPSRKSSNVRSSKEGVESSADTDKKPRRNKVELLLLYFKIFEGITVPFSSLAKFRVSDIVLLTVNLLISFKLVPDFRIMFM